MNELQPIQPTTVPVVFDGKVVDLVCRPTPIAGEEVLVPLVVLAAHENAGEKFVEFFAATIRNRNTRRAYMRAVRDFCAFCQVRSWTLRELKATHVALYIEWLGKRLAPQSVKQSLAALRVLGDHMVVNQILPMNPATSVRGPRYSISKGKTPVMEATDVRRLLDSISADSIGGLRDRALIATMVFSFARINAVVQMNVEDYSQRGKRCWFRLHEKNGKYHETPAHHSAEEYVDAYLAAAGIAEDRGGPLFRTLDRKRQLTRNRLDQSAAFRIVQKRCVAAELGPDFCNHSFRASGITVFLMNGGTLESAQKIAAHSSPRTTKLYDRTSDAITLDEIERVVI